jgi:hypothetical protein
MQEYQGINIDHEEFVKSKTLKSNASQSRSKNNLKLIDEDNETSHGESDNNPYSKKHLRKKSSRASLKENPRDKEAVP